MSASLDYSSVLQAVKQWPPEQRASLAHLLLDGLPKQQTQRPAIDELIGAAKREGPALTNEELAKWLDEYRTR